jgi:hypothetical protein
MNNQHVQTLHGFHNPIYFGFHHPNVDFVRRREPENQVVHGLDTIWPGHDERTQLFLGQRELIPNFAIPYLPWLRVLCDAAFVIAEPGKWMFLVCLGNMAGELLY